ncbi:hypothetical protein BN7_1140 [Wickerhamomyces ciferrii]|uniref:Molybdopterin synthase sulfur carrier subunit n=1 Tax=Wickerhamomyces ciferrii (strain ATCC 14091 / BCRC 22168 / CBS 111 / JCM 3599 / NBRC 0793 / NRRL Y-1031 F-60-10) TaxID=1206466 RepID=K0KJD4_WICCF|nr:uncharacterized protein BN7_1140 [Wickerhamomyces ciferrii]CCH41599.1 hypothetical protein BN7_1140 [Wickerhamomyces ciferrii]
MVTIEYFGPSKDFTNKSIESIQITSLLQLYEYLEIQYTKEFSEYVKENCGITVDYEYIDKELGVEFNEGDEICIIPPVSSG